MKDRKDSLQRRISILLVIANVCLLVIYLSGWTNSRAQNNKKIVIRPLTLVKEPIEISLFSGGRRVESTKVVRPEKGSSQEEFEADKDWLKNLTLNITNKSDKMITYIVLDLTFPETSTNEQPRIALHQVFLGVDPERRFVRPELRLPPNDSIEIPLAARFKDIKDLVDRKVRIEDITQMEVRIHQVLFDDGTLFETGSMYRRNPDPNDPRKWIKIEN
jgi:hypothetical protein